MSNASLVSLAESLATEAHEGQFRRDGVTPYIEHPRAVVSRVGDDFEAQVVAWLHDVIEDTRFDEVALVEAGMPLSVVEAVVLLTKPAGVDYECYLANIRSNPIASKVKIADMLSNLSDSPSVSQIRKYAKGLLFLVEGS